MKVYTSKHLLQKPNQRLYGLENLMKNPKSRKSWKIYAWKNENPIKEWKIKCSSVQFNELNFRSTVILYESSYDEGHRWRRDPVWTSISTLEQLSLWLKQFTQLDYRQRAIALNKLVDFDEVPTKNGDSRLNRKWSKQKHRK